MNNLSKINKFENYISSNEIAESRTCSDFIKWYESKLQLIRDELDEKRIDGRQMLLHEGIAKIFYEELYPLYKFIQNKEKQWIDVSILVRDGNQNYDVEINSSQRNIPKYLEITIADRDYEEHLRMQYMLKHGHVDMTGNVSKKNGSIIMEEEGLALSSDLISNKQEQIALAIEKKESGGVRPNDTALLVFFDDSIVFSNNDERKELDDFLNLIKITKFTCLYVVGAVKGYFFESRLIYA